MVFNVRPNQVFLKNEPTLKFIADQAEGKILEIGGGHGELTKYLTEKGKVKVIEINERLAENLKKTKAEVIVGNAMDQNFNDYDIIIGNIPYNISSQIIIKFLDSNTKKAVFTIQKELAERMTAKPGEREYSKLSVNIQNAGSCRILKIIPPEYFNPKPKVHSAVVEIEKKGRKTLGKKDKKIVDLIFQHKNQNIGKVLKKNGFKTSDDEVFRKKARNIEIREIKKISRIIEPHEGG